MLKGVAGVTQTELDAAIDAAPGEREGATVFRPTGKYSPLKMQPTDVYANGNTETGTAATHDASAGAIPSYTTAKKGSIAVVTVAGTLGGASVAKGDILHALQDNPTAAAHWAIIADSTAEFEAAVEAAQGWEVWLYGTYLLQNADPDAAVNLAGEYTILNRCGYSAIYQASNNTRAGLITPRQCASAGLGVGQGIDVDDEIGSNLQQVSYFTLSTAAHATDFPIGKKVEVFTDAIHPSEPSGSIGYISNSFEVVSVDLVGGIVYADRILKYHGEIANATNIYLIPLHEDRAVRIREGALFMGCPTLIGGEVGWYLTLDGVVPITATISGSGELTRTITVSAGVTDGYLVGQGIRIGTVSGTYTFTGKITALTSTTFTVTFAQTSGGLMKNDRGTTGKIATSGTVYFVPAWWASEFNTTTHGGALILQQAHGSVVKWEVARLWAMGVRTRFSSFCDVDVVASKVVNIGTGISGRSWRLVYITEAYSCSRNRFRVRGCGGRHAYTSSSGSTSTTWASTHWQSKSGTSCENVIDVKTSGDTGASGDTHAMTNGEKITSEVEFVTSYNTAHSYRGIGAQLRGENTQMSHKQRGGAIGLRIANGSGYVRVAGSTDEIDLDVSDLAQNPSLSGHCFHAASSGSNTPWGFWVQSQASYTHKTMTTGRFRFKSAGGGVNFEADTQARLEEYTHLEVGYAGGWLQTGSNVYIAKVNLDYSLTAGSIETTSSSSVALGTGSKTFTVPGSLVISAGQKVLVQDTANPRTNYGWGRVVSYSGTTLVVNLDAYLGSGTITAWTITTGAITPRFGFGFDGTITLTIGTLHWRVGAGANPLEIFHSRDNASGKTVNVATLIIDDPLLKGMPSFVTSGRGADFTLKIGQVIYNGVEIPREIAVTATTKTLALVDLGVIQECSNASTQLFTIPLEATVAWPTGAYVPFEQLGAGAVKLVGATGVTILCSSAGGGTEAGANESRVTLPSQGSSGYLRKTGTNTWLAAGFIDD